jgi:hypothetical protein
MTRDQVFTEVEIKHERRTEAVRRTIVHAVDILSAREHLRQGVSALPGVSDDPDTVADIMDFVDHFVMRKEQLDEEAGRFVRKL